MTLTDALYKALKLSRDLNAVSRGPKAIQRRAERRVYGRLATRLRNRLIPNR